MAKYLVLFTPEAVDPSDDSFSGKFAKLMFAYPEDKDGWSFESTAAAKKEIKDNDYVLGRDCIIVRVLK